MKLITSLVGIILLLTICVTNTEARGFRRTSNSGGGTYNSRNEPLDQSPTYKNERLLLKLVNEKRKEYNLPPLILDRRLHLQARQHCWWMARSRNMTHSTGVAENIAMGQPTATAVVSSWMNSPGHRANILNPSYRRIGLAGYYSTNRVTFWCQQFE